MTTTPAYRTHGLSLMTASLLALGLSAWARADEVVFNNGDRLTGTIAQLDGSKMTVKTAVAGEITADLANIKSFTVDRPMAVQLRDGSVQNGPVSATAPGTAQVKTENGVKEVPYGQIKGFYEPGGKWKGAVRAGVTMTRGNTETTTAVAGFELQRRFTQDRFTALGEYNYGKDRDPDTGEDNTTVDNWKLGAKYDHFLTEKWYTYATTTAERDNIADLNLRLAPGVGVGYQWLEGPQTNISSELGLSYIYERYAGGDCNEFLAARAAYHVDHKLNNRVKLVHNFEILPSLDGSSEYLLNTDAGARVSLTGDFFAEFKVELKYNSAPAEGNEKSDVRYVTSIGWQF